MWSYYDDFLRSCSGAGAPLKTYRQHRSADSLYAHMFEASQALATALTATTFSRKNVNVFSCVCGLYERRCPPAGSDGGCERQLVHLDLKSQNVLLHDKNFLVAKIADLGLSKYLVEGSLLEFTMRGELAGWLSRPFCDSVDCGQCALHRR